MHTVLIVEAEAGTLKRRADELLLDGYELLGAQSNRQARAKLGVPALDGVVLGALETPVARLALLRDLRSGEVPGADPGLPVLSIGSDEDHDAIRHYQAGADVVLPKSPSPLLVASALTVLMARTDGARRRLLRIGAIAVNCDARAVTVHNQELSLTRLEFDLLEMLAHQPNTVMTRERIARSVWNTEIVAGRTIDAHAARLRSKLGAAAPQLQTVWGVGYRLGR